MKKQNKNKNETINTFIIGLICGAILVASCVHMHDIVQYTNISIKLLLYSMLLGITIGISIIAIVIGINRR
jgi:Ni/Fe-hydrogenase subunit HybB-like protein